MNFEEFWKGENQEEKKPNLIHEAVSKIDKNLPDNYRPPKTEIKPPKKAESPLFALLSENVDDIEDMVMRGISFRKIAKKYGVSEGTFVDWRLRSEYSTRIEAALIASSEYHADKSFEILQEGIDSGTENMAEVQLRRELAQGHRWMSKIRNPKVFGDKTQHQHDHKIIAPPTDAQFDALLQTVEKTAEKKKEVEAEDIDHEEVN